MMDEDPPSSDPNTYWNARGPLTVGVMSKVKSTSSFRPWFGSAAVAADTAARSGSLLLPVP